MNRATYYTVAGSLGLALSFSSFAIADETPKPTKEAPSATKPTGDQTQQLNQRLVGMLNNVKFVGRFIVTGKDNGPLAKEEYTIHKVEKLPEGEKWMFHCRIKYGNHDVAIPLPIDVKWAGETPIITLDDLTIPGMGTFSSRVVLHDNKYAGTWRHDQVGGHLFGTIEKIPEQDAKSESKPTKE